MIRSFSGAHPFRPQCLRPLLDAEYLEEMLGLTPDEQLLAIVSHVDAGRCPRCERQIPSDQAGAGSRVTRCRCVPICGPCGEHEVLHLTDPADWPAYSPEEVDAWRRNMLAKHMRPGFLSGETLITEDGASRVKPRPNPGGWAEFGYDDEADREERER